MTVPCLENKTFKDLRTFLDEDWKSLREYLLDSVFSRLQPADAEDSAHNLLLRLLRHLARNELNHPREDAPLGGYIFNAAKNRLKSFFGKLQRSRELLIGEEVFDIVDSQADYVDLEWVSEDFKSLKPQDRTHLNAAILEKNSVRKIAKGSKKLAGRLYKRTFDAKGRLRSALLRSVHQRNIHIRGVNFCLPKVK